MGKQTIYDEVEIEDFVWDPVARLFHYPCPCGDRFEISKLMLKDGEDIATCPSCSLIVRVIFDPLEWEDYEDSEDEDDGESVSSASSPASSTVSVHSAKEDDTAAAGIEEKIEGEVEQLAQGVAVVSLA